MIISKRRRNAIPSAGRFLKIDENDRPIYHNNRVDGSSIENRSEASLRPATTIENWISRSSSNLQAAIASGRSAAVEIRRADPLFVCVLPRRPRRRRPHNLARPECISDHNCHCRRIFSSIILVDKEIPSTARDCLLLLVTRRYGIPALETANPPYSPIRIPSP